jgi:hypothetical protein
MPPWTLISLLEKETNDGDQITCRVNVSVNGKQGAEVPLTFEFQGHSRMRMLTTAQGLVIAEAGALEINLLFEDRVLATWKIGINLVAAPQIEPISAPPTPEQSGAAL